MNPSAHCTHPALQIRHAQDVHKVFEAVRLGILPLIRRRLSPSERDLLAAGQVYVWEEASSATTISDDGATSANGLERWTDGRRWSQSRMREPFLYYEEKVEATLEEKQAKAERRARKHSAPSSPISPDSSLAPIRRQDRPSKPNGLTKQTYSSYVQLSPHAPPKKWHCVAYFISADFDTLPVVESYAYLRDLPIPEGVYVSAKGSGRLFNAFATPGGRLGVVNIEPAIITNEHFHSRYGHTPPGSGGSASSDSASTDEIPHAHLVPTRPSFYYSSSPTGSISTSGSRSPATPSFSEYGSSGSAGSAPPSSFRQRPSYSQSGAYGDAGHQFPSWGNDLSKSQTTIKPAPYPGTTPHADAPEDVEMMESDDYFHYPSQQDHRPARSNASPHSLGSSPLGFPRRNRQESLPSPQRPPLLSSPHLYPRSSTPLNIPSPTGVHGRSVEDVKALRAFKVSL